MARVYVSTVVNVRNDRVWARVRDFNGLSIAGIDSSGDLRAHSEDRTAVAADC